VAKDGGPVKPVPIRSRIGKRPILAAGNSTRVEEGLVSRDAAE